MDLASIENVDMHALNYCLGALTPTAIIRPENAAAVAETLRAATAARQSVVPWGGGTRQHLAGPPTRYDLALDLRQMQQVVEYSPEDLVIRVAAGATLGSVQQLLAASGQWLPWDPPLPNQATLGGLLASGAAGPLRFGYGAPRDWTLGMQVALGDGRLVRSGAQVVKNVAGYDSHKLHLGAFGTLGVIVEVTLKVAPLPVHRQSLLAVFPDRRESVLAMEQLRATPLQPIALVALSDQVQARIAALEGVFVSHPPHILVAARFAGTAGAVQRQIRAATQRCVELGARTIELALHDDSAFWASLADFSAPTHDESLLVRVGVPAGSMMDMARQIERVPMLRQWPSARLVLAGVGLGYTRWNVSGVPVEAQLAALQELRTAMHELGGYCVVEEVPVATSDHLDRWGPPPATLPMMRALRSQWDPAGILNPGRYLVH